MRPVVWTGAISQHLRYAMRGPQPVEPHGTYRAIVAGNVLGLVELLEDVLRKDLAKLNTHLVW